MVVGAGKSNLVGMIEKYLTNETAHPELKGKYYFFTYDAYGDIKMIFRGVLFWKN